MPTVNNRGRLFLGLGLRLRALEGQYGRRKRGRFFIVGSALEARARRSNTASAKSAGRLISCYRRLAPQDPA